MSDVEIAAVLDRLVESLADEQGDWEDVLHRSGLRQRRRRVRANWVVLAAAAIASVLVALVLASPWHGGPDVIDRAAAAIEVPTPGQILYERIQIRANFAAVVARLRRQGRLPRRLRSHIPQQWVGEAQVWIEGAPPHRFRFTITGRWKYANGAVIAAPPAEIGGRLSSFDGLAYDAHFRTLHPVAFDYATTQAVLDPAAFVKAALTTQRANVEGTTIVDGRKAIRIRVRARVYGQLEPVADYFVDAHTYRPIRVVITERIAPNNGPTLPGMPLTSLTEIEQATVPAAGGNYIFDISEYQHLPPTAADRKLTDIKAMHPHAQTD